MIKLDISNQFLDADSFAAQNKEASFRSIVLTHLQRISNFASVEFRGGYWEEKQLPAANQVIVTRVYVPDTREVYSNAVECLADYLFSYYDAEMIAAEDECNKEIHEALKRSTIEPERMDQGENNDWERKFIDDNKKILFRGERRKIMRKLFRHLCSFLHRKKYLELGSIED